MIPTGAKKGPQVDESNELYDMEVDELADDDEVVVSSPIHLILLF